LLNARHLGQVSEDVRRAALGCCAELAAESPRAVLARPRLPPYGAHPIEHARHPLWVPETRCASCDLLILVEQPTESVASSDVIDLGSGALGQGP
jgi:hypothetical protein